MTFEKMTFEKNDSTKWILSKWLKNYFEISFDKMTISWRYAE